MTVYGIRTFKLLGVEKLIVTNASGGLNPSFNIGDFMIISDHVSFAGMAGKILLFPYLSNLTDQIDQIANFLKASIHSLDKI